MKKVLVLALLILLTGCSSNKDCCGTRKVYVPKEKAGCQGCCVGNCRQSVRQSRPAVKNYDNCQERSRTVREPVEVIYKTTRYRTVYEPKTYTDVVYEKGPYRGGNCYNCR